jgi:hypothetical protein
VVELFAVALLSAAPVFFVVLFLVEVAVAESCAACEPEAPAPVFFFFFAFVAVLESDWL